MKILPVQRSTKMKQTCGYVLALLIGLSVTLFSGCSQTQSSGGTTPTQPTQPSSPGVSGTVNGGQVPVSGAVMQLYAVGSAGDGSAATPLLTGPVTSDAYGGFSLGDKYTCPSPATLVYLTATGGNPNPGAGTNNASIALMAALGPCGTLNSSTFIQMNELTTVASVFALSPYMTSFDHLGHGSSDSGAFSAAFATVHQLVNNATGTIPGPALATGNAIPTSQINTVADILASCVDSAGGVAGDSTPCGQLFQNSGGAATTNTIAAAVQIANHPGANTPQLFSLISPASPFQPTLSTAPPSFQIAVLPVTTAPLPVAPTPTITAPGAAAFPLTVSITDSLAGASIHYTTDGSTPTVDSPVYTSPLSISATTSISAIAVAPGYADSPIASSMIVLLPVALMPTITASAATSFPITVAITDSLPGTIIYYTTDGSTPTSGSTLYTAPFTVSATTTVQAIAVASGYTSSPVASSLIAPLLVAPAPVIAPAGNNSFPVTVSISDSLSGAEIHYTTDGSTPTAASPLYTDPLSIPAVTTVSAIAIASGYANSLVASRQISLLPPATTPTITPVAGSTFPIAVTITDVSQNGSRIYYTTDGSTPTSASTLYTASFTITASTIVKAIAVAPGYSYSDVASITYGNISPAYTTNSINVCNPNTLYDTTSCTPYSIAINSVTNTVYVSQQNTNPVYVDPAATDVTVLNGDTDTVSKFISVQQAGTVWAIAANPVTNTIYTGGDGLAAVNGDTFAVTPIPAVDSTYVGSIQINPLTNQVIALCPTQGSNVYVVDANTGNAASFAAGPQPSAMDLNPTTNHLYVGGVPNLLNIDVATSAIVDAFTATSSESFNNSPPSVVVNATTNKVYIATNSVLVYDPITTTTTPVGGTTYPISIAVNPTTNTIYSVNYNSVAVIDGATNTVTTTIPLSTGAQTIGTKLIADPGLNRVYVFATYRTPPATALQTALYVLDGSTNTLSTVYTGSALGNAALNPVTHKLYATNGASNILVFTPH